MEVQNGLDKNVSVETNKQESFSNELEYVNVKGTPFTVVKHEERYKILIGNVLVSEKTYDAYEKAEKRINKIDWELIVNSILIINEKIKQNEQ